MSTVFNKIRNWNCNVKSSTNMEIFGQDIIYTANRMMGWTPETVFLYLSKTIYSGEFNILMLYIKRLTKVDDR